MLFVLHQLRRVRKLAQLAVDARADIALLGHVLQHLYEFALAPPHHRGQYHQLRALGQGHDLVHDLVHSLLLDGLAALGAVRHANPGVHQPKVVVDLRHRANGGTGVAAGGLLVDGDGGGKAFDVVHIRLLHLSQELSGVGRQRFHIAPLALGVDGVKGQAALAAAGQAGHHDQLVAGNDEVDVFKVVLPRALDDDLVDVQC